MPKLGTKQGPACEAEVNGLASVVSSDSDCLFGMETRPTLLFHLLTPAVSASLLVSRKDDLFRKYPACKLHRV